MEKKKLTRKSMLDAALKTLDLISNEVGHDIDAQKAVLCTADTILANDRTIIAVQGRS